MNYPWHYIHARPQVRKIRLLVAFRAVNHGRIVELGSPGGRFRFMVHEGTVTAKVFKQFLERLMAGATKPIFLIVDGHPTHRSKLVRDFVASTNGRLQLFFLPPYSPHLNPDEQVWAHVKREVSRRGVDSLEEMKRLALSALRRIQKLPDLVRSFFRQPECMYASDGFTS